jgi:hypothetical protein
MIAGLQEVDLTVAHAVHKAMLLSEPSRPGSSEKMLERLGLPDPRERIAQDCLDQIQGPQRDLSISFDPDPEVFAKFRLENGNPITPAGALLFDAKPELALQLLDRLRFYRAGLGPLHGGEKTFCILGRAQKVSGLAEPRQLGSGD